MSTWLWLAIVVAAFVVGTFTPNLVSWVVYRVFKFIFGDQ